jgi:hypothetical protein
MIAAISGAVIGAIAVALAVANRFWPTRASREARLSELRRDRDQLPDLIDEEAITKPDLKRLVSFLETLDECRAKRTLRLPEIDRAFGQWFFETAHSHAGLELILDDDYIRRIGLLYQRWLRFRLRHHRDQFDSAVARRWARHTKTHHAKGRVLWHHEIQEHPTLGDAALVFWRLGFRPSYNRQTILHSIEEICEAFQVSSYVAYELLGPHDILLRLWLSHPGDISDVHDPLLDEPGKPSRQPQKRIDDITRRLSAHITETTSDYFLVTEVHRHWWWCKSRWWRRRADPDRLKPGFANEISKDVKGKQAVQDLVNLYNDGTRSWLHLWRSREWRRYRRKGFVRHHRLHGGIKFATIVRPKDSQGFVHVDDGEHPVATAVRDATRVKDRSLYEGSGFNFLGLGAAQFLILGRVPGYRFGRLRTEIIEPIVKDTPIARSYAPTLTYVATGPETMRQTYRDGVKHH